jgi:hypothetical protein
MRLDCLASAREPLRTGGTMLVLLVASTHAPIAAGACTNCSVFLPGPIAPTPAVVFVPPTAATAASGVAVSSSALGALQGTSGAIAAIAPTAVGTSGAHAVGPAGTGFTTVVKAEGDVAAGMRRGLAAVQPHVELPKPSECVAQGEFEKTTATPDPLWQRMTAAAERRLAEAAASRGGANGAAGRARAQPVVGDRGASRASDLGLGSPVRGPARDVFGAPSHVVLVAEPEATPDAARAYFFPGAPR